MASGAVVIELQGMPLGNPIRGTVRDGVQVRKGDLMFWEDPKTLSGANANVADVPFAGIANTEKRAGDASTTLGVDTRGVFDIKITDNVTITVGQSVKISGANLIAPAGDLDLSGGFIMGRALETGTTGEVIQVAVGFY